MKFKKYIIDEVNNSSIYYIPDTCAFCKNKPTGLLKIRIRFFSNTHKFWICSKCRHKWINGELKI